MQTLTTKKQFVGMGWRINNYEHLTALKSEYLSMMQSIDDLPIPGRDVEAIRAEAAAARIARNIAAAVPPKLGRKFRT